MSQQFPKGIRFAHFRNIYYPGGYPQVQSWGGMTVAYMQDVDQDGGPIVYAACAFCHDNDNYDKRLGRIKSCGQLIRLARSGGHADDDTIMGQRFYVLAGLVEDVAPDLLKKLAQDSGYEQLRKFKQKDKIVL